MTALTPEENQGGGADKSLSTALSDSSGDLSLSSPLLDVPFHGLAPPEVAVPSISPILDSSKVISGLERGRSLSPRRYSVDVECDSIASDYSELGGTLKDIERDVHYLADKDVLIEKSEGVGEGGFSLAQQLGLGRDSELVGPPERQENENETDFQRRLRKVNILSLAQEFALLKKVDTLACPINFHRINTGKALRNSASPSPVSSRGHSLERTRRTHSKSPLRKAIIHNAAATNSDKRGGGKQSTLTSTMPHIDPATTNTSAERKKQSSISHSSPSTTTTTAHKPITILEDLPINEARRRNSGSDLPANMRPERRAVMMQDAAQTGVSKSAGLAVLPSSSSKVGGGGGGGGVEADGDFDVYNIENTLPNLDWKTLERQLERVESEEKTRLEACKNEREEIRRRLAMTEDDREHEEEEDDDDDDLRCPMVRNPRLQTSLEGAQNMQICFIPDDLLDDEDDVDDTARSGAHSSSETTATTTTTTSSKERIGDDTVSASTTSEEDTLAENDNDNNGNSEEEQQMSTKPLSNRRPDPRHIASRQSQLQTEATLALAQASTMARMQLEVEKQTKKKSPIADMVGIPTLGSGRRMRLSKSKLFDMNIAQLQVLVNDLHSQIELLNEDLVHLLIERDDLHMEQDSMLVDIEDLTSHCHDPNTTNNNKSSLNKNRPDSDSNRKHLPYH